MQVIACLDTRAVPRPIKREAKMVASSIPLAKQVIQAQSIAVTLDDDQERRFQRLVKETTMIDLHQHPMVKPEDPSQLLEYLRGDSYVWGYEAVRHGGFTAVGTANVYRGMLNTDEMSFIRFEDLLDEIGMMLSDVGRHDEVVKVSNAGEIEAAKQHGQVGNPPGEELPAANPDPHMGLEHFGLRTDDLEGLVSKLQAQGVEVLEPIREGRNGTICYIKAPDNVRIEIQQYAREP